MPGTTVWALLLLYSYTIFLLYLFLPVLSLRCCVDFPLVEENMGYSSVGMRGLLIVVASLIVEHGLQGIRASGVVAPGL